MIQDYPDAPGVQSAMMSLQSDRPTYHQPQYKPPNKWAELGAALLGLAFSSAPIGKFAAGFSGGLGQGAEDSYKRAQTNAQDQYSAELNQQLADEKQAGLAVTFADTQARIKEQQAVAAQRLQYDNARLEQNQERIGLYAKSIYLNDKHVQQRLMQNYQLAQQHMAVTMRGQNLTASERVMGINATMAVAQFHETATNARFRSNLQVKDIDQQLGALKTSFDRQAIADDKITDANARQAAISQHISDYNSAVTGLIDNALHLRHQAPTLTSSQT